VIPSEFQPFVSALISSGEFSSENDVVSAALGSLERERRRNQQLRAALQAGLDQIERGECTTLHNDEEIDEFFDRIEVESEAELQAERDARP
jgi:putative addiction module CopG family antidote